MLQIRRGNRDNLGINVIFLHKNIFCDPPLEPSHQDGFNEGSQHTFLLRNKKKLSLNYPNYPLLSGALDYIPGKLHVKCLSKVVSLYYTILSILIGKNIFCQSICG